LNEAPKKLRGGQGHLSVLVAVGVILPAERHPLSVESEQPMVTDGDSMGVAAKVTEHLSRSPECRFGVDHPVSAEQGAQESSETSFFGQGAYAPMEAELLVSMQSP